MSDEQPATHTGHTAALAFDSVVGHLENVLGDLEGWEGFTWSPKSRLRYDITAMSQASAMFLELVRGSRDFRPDLPIYLIAITCNTDISINRTLRKGYEILARKTNQPLIGYWRDSLGIRYLDAVLPVQFKSGNMAVREARRHEQDYIVEVGAGGDHRHIEIR